jgi:molybdopterin synthase sulfur carrier subunit
MDWRLFANLAEAAGTRRVTVDAEPGDTFRDAFDQLLAAHPELEAEVLDDEGEIRDHIRVLRNDHDPFVTDDGYDTVLEDGDKLALFPPVSGGCGAG